METLSRFAVETMTCADKDHFPVLQGNVFISENFSSALGDSESIKIFSHVSALPYHAV